MKQYMVSLLTISLFIASYIFGMDMHNDNDLKSRIDKLEIQNFEKEKDKQLKTVHLELCRIGIIPDNNSDNPYYFPWQIIPKTEYYINKMGSSPIFPIFLGKWNKLMNDKSKIKNEFDFYKNNASQVYTQYQNIYNNKITCNDQIFAANQELSDCTQQVEKLHRKGLTLANNAENLCNETNGIQCSRLGLTVAIIAIGTYTYLKK